jgi:hypothetical protein
VDRAERQCVEDAESLRQMIVRAPPKYGRARVQF